MSAHLACLYQGPLAFSQGNMKVGKMFSLSLMPGRTCIPDAPCLRSCYALKPYLKSAQKTWAANTDAYNADHAEFWRHVNRFVSFHMPAYFRWHVGGDCPDEDYCDAMMALAVSFPSTRFLAFSKRYAWWNKLTPFIPHNLSIVLSAWPGYPMPETRLPIAWMQDGTEPRVTQYAMPCGGSCTTCGDCWHLSDGCSDVVFKKH
jgi:hypothetical protein